MLSQGVIIGRQHRLMQQNCQDYASTGRGAADGCYFGLVADGCGSKYSEPGQGDSRPVFPSHNEVGAKLLGHFAAGWLAENLGNMGTQEVCLLLDELSLACGNFLQSLLALLPHQGETGRARLVATHLLATLVGFVVTPSAAAFFWAGDGYLGQDGQWTRLDEGNRPHYLAYHLLGMGDGRLKVSLLRETQEISWLAVATDGWHEECLAELAAPRPNLELKRWLNLQARQRGRFEDDGAVAAWYRD